MNNLPNRFITDTANPKLSAPKDGLNYKAVMGVIGADCHAVGNKVLDTLLTRGGIEVINLGVMVSQQEFIDAAIKNKADAILVSSIYGHGEIDCQGFRSFCDANGLLDILLYVGGNLVVGKQDFRVVEEHFLDMGFDRVFPPSVDIDRAISLLKSDIELNRTPNLGHNSRKFGETQELVECASC